jgi:hypothetical protein
MAAQEQKKQSFRIARDGGLHLAQQCLGLNDLKAFARYPYVVFCMHRFKASKEDRSNLGIPLVEEFGIATLDT